MKPALALVSLLALAGCGADGEPQKPQINGNVTLSNSGVYAGTSVSVGPNPFRLGLGLGL
ncbi:hypothetical protein [Roseobacter sp. GAI101]|uniref:hypothetical protein n=1 Tax=Roseobacter sp. (strain GAI101) TaxID=391589 RepID=UPI0002E78D13|nr:hypothetical protein [Roseobacter sp. GAI101]